MSGGSIISVTLGDDAIGKRLDRALADALPQLSRERIKALLAAGDIDGGGTRLQPSGKLNAPLDLTITLPPAAPDRAEAQAIALDVVHEDAHLIVIDKPAGMVVHPANGNPDGTLVNALLHHCCGQLSGIGGVARPGIVHRIDKDTSGLIVAAKSDVAHEGLSRLFAAHDIHRAYHAIAAGRVLPPTGMIDAPLARSPHDRKKIAVSDSDRAKRAVTHYRTLEALRDATLIECRLETGRTHQVRVHMTHIGHPLLGDPVYARSQRGHGATLKMLGFVRQALHAAELGFTHPVSGEPLLFRSALPADMQELLSRLRV